MRSGVFGVSFRFGDRRTRNLRFGTGGRTRNLRFGTGSGRG
jgi:hypothetical protein